jgi:RHS repeat-associated protein
LVLGVSLLQMAALPQRVPASPLKKPMTCPASVSDESAAVAAAHKCGGRVEVGNAESESAQVWANSDGTVTAEVYQAPVRVKRQGVWVPVDLSLAMGSAGSVAPRVDPQALVLSGTAGGGEHDLVALGSGGARLAVGWSGALPAPLLRGSAATYPEVKPGIDVVVKAVDGGFEQDVVVKDRQAAALVTDWGLPLHATGLRAATAAGGGLTVKDRRGRTVASVAAPRVWDARTLPGSGGPLRLVGGRLALDTSARTPLGTVHVVTDAGVFSDASVVYPVTIATRFTAGAGTSTVVQNGGSTSGFDAGGLSLGQGSAGLARSYLKWPTGRFDGRQVTSATLSLWETGAASCAPSGWELWTAGAAVSGKGAPVWQRRESSSQATTGHGVGCEPGWVGIDATGFVQHAVSGHASTAWLGLRAQNESDAGGWKQFSSAGAVSDPPRLTVTYRAAASAKPKASPADSPASGRPSYTYATQAASYVDGTTVLPFTQGVREVHQVALPFAFTFYGTSYSNAWIDSNGVMSFLDPGTPPDWTASPDPAQPNAAIYAFREDFEVTADSSIRTATIGTAPNRSFVIEWNNVQLLESDGDEIDVEAILSENGTITLNYAALVSPSDKGQYAFVGVEDETGTYAVVYEAGQPALADGTAVVFTPTRVPRVGYTTSTRAQTYVSGTSTLWAPPAGGDGFLDDDFLQTAPPFPVTFYGQAYQHLWVDTNGLVYFDDPAGRYTVSLATPPSPLFPNNTAYVFGDDLAVPSDGLIRTAVTGTAPNRTFVIEWYNVVRGNSDWSDHFNAEVVFSENTGEISFNYSGLDTTDEQGAQAIVGVENPGGTAAAVYGDHQPLLANSTAVVFTVAPGPGAPGVSSPDYPADGHTHGQRNKPGEFTFTPATGTTNPAGYQFQLDSDIVPRQVAATGSATVFATPTAVGDRTLTVWAKDSRGTLSDPTVYHFTVGPDGPVDYAYDAAGQLVGVSQGGDSARYSYDAAGNVSGIERYPTANPSVMSVVPARAASGSQVTISGTGFSTQTAADVVTFIGSSPATVVSATATRLVVTVPGNATTGTVSVQVSGAGAVASAQPFTIIAATPVPTVTGVSTHLAVPGTSVTVQGSGFDTDTTHDIVSFGRTRARVTAASAGGLTVTVPDAAGAGPVAVKTAGGTATDTQNFQVVPHPYAAADVQSVTGLAIDGAAQALTIASGKVVVLTFPATIGQHLSLGLSGDSVNGALEVAGYDQYGAPFSRNQYDRPWAFAGNGGLALAPVTASGIYQIVLDPDSTASGSVTVSLSTRAAGVLSTTDAGTAINLDRPGRYADLSFDAVVGQRFTLAFTNWGLAGAAGLKTTVLSPRGETLADYAAPLRVSQYADFTANESGTFHVLLGTSDASTATATVVLSPATDAGTLSVDGSSVPLSFARTGQESVLHFTATAGQRIGLGFGGNTTGNQPAITVIRPDGVTVTQTAGQTLDLFTLALSGTYELDVDPVATGSMTAYLSTDLDGGTLTLNDAATTVNVTRPGQNVLLHFAGTAGQTPSLGFTGSLDGTDDVYVYRPDGTLYTLSRIQGGLGLAALPVTGTYSVVVSPTTGATGTVVASLSDGAVDGGTLSTTGGAASVTITRPGQDGLFHFTGASGQRLSLGFTASTLGQYWVTVTRPDGTTLQPATLCSGTDASLLLPVLPAAGTYAIDIDPYNAATGSISATLSEDVDSGTLTIGGTGTTVTVTRPGQAGVLHFAGTTGAALTMGFSNITLAYQWYQVLVLTPSGSTLESDDNFSTLPIDLPTLPATGTYTVIVGPDNAGTGSLTVALSTTSGGSAAPALATSPDRTRSQTATDRDPCTATIPPTTGPTQGVHTAHPLDGPTVAGWQTCGTPTAATGWTPDQRNIAGGDWNSRNGTPPTVPKTLPVAPAGTTALAGQVFDDNDTPLSNVDIRIGQTKTVTDGQGRFLLAGVPAGHQVLHVDGGHTHGIFDIGVDLNAGRTVTLPYTLWLPLLDTAHQVSIPSPTRHETVITTPAIPGLELRIPAGTVIRDEDGKVVTTLGITAIPDDRPPFPLPPSQVPSYFTIQPGGAYLFPQGAELVYPNYTHEAPGTVLDFWHYDPAGRGWYIYGHGTVTPDGTQVMPDKNTRVYQFTGAMLVTPGYTPPPTGPKPGGTDSTGGDPVDLASGLVVDNETDLSLNDVIPLNLTRTYQQADQSTRAFGIADNFGYGINLWSDNRYAEADLILPDGGRIHYTRATPNPLDFTNASFTADANPTEFAESILSFNGNGWDLKLVTGQVLVFGVEAPLQSIRDKYGNTVTITRAPAAADTDGIVRAKGPITQVTSPNGQWIKFSYDSSGRITTAQDVIGRTVIYTYTTDGHLHTVTNAANGVTTYTYDTNGRLKTVTDPRNTTYLTNDYDANGRVSKQTLANTGTYTFAYTLGTDGTTVTQTQVTDPRGAIRKVEFNGAGYSITDTAALGTPQEQTIHIERSVDGDSAVSHTDALGHKTTTARTIGDELSQLAFADGTTNAETTTFEYGTSGELLTVTDPMGHVTRYQYDSRDALQKATDPINRPTTYTSNNANQITSITDNLGEQTQYTYSLGDPVTSIDPTGAVSRLVVDAAGRVIASTDPLARTTTLAYDAMDRVTSITDPLGRVAAFEYDPNSNLTKVTDPRGGITSYTYDVMDHTKSMTDPLQHTETYDYDLGGNLTKVTDRRGKVTTYIYDPLGRLTQVSYAVTGTTNESQITYTYDAGNRLTQTVDSAAGITGYRPDALDRIASVTTPERTIFYEYDKADRRTSMTVAGQSAVRYAYSNNDELVDVQQGNEQIAIPRDAVGRRHQVQIPTGPDTYTQTTAYDPAGRTSQITYTNQTNTIGNLTYTYDAAGQPIQTGGSDARTNLPKPFSQATYNAANQLTQLATTTLSYDNNGNLTNDGTTTYTWNARDQLTTLTNSAQTASFTYNADGNRTSKTINAATTNYLYDGDTITQEMSGTTPTANLLSAGLDNTLVREDLTGTGWSRAYLTDAQGSTTQTDRFIDGTSGGTDHNYSYEPYGRVTDNQPSCNTASTCDSDPNQYTGRENDGTGLNYNRARYYNPTLQRFISQDPLSFASGDTNLYAYVQNQPTQYTDPFGSNSKSSAPPSGQTAGSYRFVVNSSGTVADLKPDLQSLARTHADTVLASTPHGTRPPTASSAAYDSTNQTVYFGTSGSIPSDINYQLRSRMPDPSLEPWPSGNCAEFNSCNNALNAGARLDNLRYGTVRTRTGLPFPSCANCRAALSDAKEMLN